MVTTCIQGRDSFADYITWNMLENQSSLEYVKLAGIFCSVISLLMMPTIYMLAKRKQFQLMQMHSSPDETYCVISIWILRFIRISVLPTTLLVILNTFLFAIDEAPADDFVHLEFPTPKNITLFDYLMFTN